MRDRVGFRRWNSEAEETEYLILRDAFRDEVCKGQSCRAVLKELAKRGFLVRDGQNLTIKARLPGTRDATGVLHSRRDFGGR